jgi:hypothetical protein
MATIQVRNGGLDTPVVVAAGATVADVREAVEASYGIDSSAKAFLTHAGLVSEVTREDEVEVQDGDAVEFMKEPGKKG